MTPAATRRTRAIVVAALSLGIGLLLLEIASVLLVQRHVDSLEQVSNQRLLAALQTFRPSETAGREREVPLVDLDPARSVRSEPAGCAPLTLLSTGSAIGGASWTGVSGDPRQPVTTLTVRYADADAARAAVREKQLTLLRCRTVRLTFPPYDKGTQTFDVGYGVGALLPPDQVGYRLVSGEDAYGFYVRRWGNTLTWTYSDDETRTAVSRRVVDDLANRLSAMSRE